MAVVQKQSVHVPLAAAAGRLLFEAARRAEAMGVVGPAEAGGADAADLGSVRKLAARIRQAGIASAASAALHNVDAPSASDVADLLRTMIAALEASPVPKFEWAGLGRVLDPERLASLLAVSISSLNRHQTGARDTPAAISAPPPFLSLAVGHPAGADHRP